MDKNSQTYMIQVSGQVTGPHFLEDLIRLREQGGLPDYAKIIYPGESWSQATELRDSPKLLNSLQKLLNSSDANSIVMLGLSRNIVSRYTDAYTQANAIATVGSAIKTVAVLVGLLILIIGLMIAASTSFYAFFIAVVLACIFTIPTYILGILVSAHGQTQLATLDTAVNSSRHLSNDEVAEILSKRFNL